MSAQVGHPPWSLRSEGDGTLQEKVVDVPLPFLPRSISPGRTVVSGDMMGEEEGREVELVPSPKDYNDYKSNEITGVKL